MEKEKPIALDANIMKHMSIGRIFKDSDQQIIGIDFSLDGELLIAYTETSLTVYQVSSAKKLKTLNNRITGISHLKFTHSNTAVIFTPQTAPFDIFVWSIYENEIIKSFEGGEARICSLHTNLSNDLVLIIDESKMLKIYNLAEGKSACLKMDFRDQNALAATFDPSGEIFSTAVTSSKKIAYVELHRIEGVYKGIFKRFTINDFDSVLDLRFDHQGVNLFLLFKGGKSVLINTTSEDMLDVPLNIELGEDIPEVNFSPDSKFILMGGSDALIKVLEVRKTGILEICKLQGHIRPCNCVKFSPKYLMIASACQHLIFWLPQNWELSF